MSAALHIEREGAGPRLALLHGWGMNLRVFDPLRARLAQALSLSLVDLPGHGKSPWPADFSVSRQRETLAAALLPTDALLGWSLGGQLALSLALAAQATPAAPKKLILVATTPRFLAGDGWAPGLSRETLQHFAQSLERDPSGTISDFLGLQVRGSRRAVETERELRAALDGQGMAQLPALRLGLAMLATTDLRDRAGALELPTLLLGGVNDRVTPPAALEAMANLLPRARLILLPGAAHAPFLSHPDEVAQAVLEFLAA